jgi:hypothetical protein
VKGAITLENIVYNDKELRDAYMGKTVHTITGFVGKVYFIDVDAGFPIYVNFGSWNSNYRPDMLTIVE